MAGRCLMVKWVLVMVLADVVLSSPGLVMVKEGEGMVRGKREVVEELDTWMRAMRSEGVSGGSDVEMEEVDKVMELEAMEVMRMRREVGPQPGKGIKILAENNVDALPKVRSWKLGALAETDIVNEQLNSLP